MNVTFNILTNSGQIKSFDYPDFTSKVPNNQEYVIIDGIQSQVQSVVHDVQYTQVRVNCTQTNN